jgi:UDP-N-acetylmuramate dehydrogenase
MSAVDDAARRLGDLARADVPIGPLTTYRVGGAAALHVVVDDEPSLAAVTDAVAASGVDVLVVGKGSNLLLCDAGFDGLAITLGDRYAEIAIDGTHVRAGAAAALPVVARRTAAAGLSGFEWAVGVPGSIGGAVRMNAGGHGSDMAASLVRVRVVDLRTGEDEVMAASRLALGYRRSALEPHHLVLHADLQLEAGEVERSEALIGEIVTWRRANQPGGQNAGSVFTNPPDDSAGRLIDAAGCKGMRKGTAEVSTKHANFFQADPGGSADDIDALMRVVRRQVHDRLGVVLAPETVRIGFPPLEDLGGPA